MNWYKQSQINVTKNQKEIMDWLIGCPAFMYDLGQLTYEYEMSIEEAKNVAWDLKRFMHSKGTIVPETDWVHEYLIDNLERLRDYMGSSSGEKRSINNLIQKIERGEPIPRIKDMDEFVRIINQEDM